MIKDSEGNPIDIIDLAGFHDQNRGIAEIFAVNFQLKRSIEGSEEFKIILAIDHGTLANRDYNVLSQPFRDII